MYGLAAQENRSDSSGTLAAEDSSSPWLGSGLLGCLSAAHTLHISRRLGDSTQLRTSSNPWHSWNTRVIPGGIVEQVTTKPRFCGNLLMFQGVPLYPCTPNDSFAEGLGFMPTRTSDLYLRRTSGRRSQFPYARCILQPFDSSRLNLTNCTKHLLSWETNTYST